MSEYTPYPTGPTATRLDPRGSRNGPRLGSQEQDLAPGSPGYDVLPGNWIPGGIRIDPRLAAFFYAGKHKPEFPVAGDSEPVQVTNRLTTQFLASENSPNFWKSRPHDRNDPAIRGTAALAPVKPWVKKWIPPLAMFNDASQWVNILMFHRPMAFGGKDSSLPPLKAQYFSPPPIETSNLSAGNLNLQLQLGNIAIQGQQLTTSASNYFG